MSAPSHFLCRANSINHHGRESCSREQSSPRLCDFSHKDVSDSTLKSRGQSWVLASGRTEDLFSVCVQNCIGNSFEGPACIKRIKASERVLVASSTSGSEDNNNIDLHFVMNRTWWMKCLSFRLIFSHICLHTLLRWDTDNFEVILACFQLCSLLLFSQWLIWIINLPL